MLDSNPVNTPRGLYITLLTEKLGLDFERASYEPLLHSQDRLEALKAFKEKRAPVFKGE